MPIHDDDDELSFFESPRGSPRDRRDESWDFDEEGNLGRDFAPDDLATIRCTNCKKLIFEDAVRCPYCKQLQLESDHNKKPFWFWATVIFCILALGGFSVISLLRMLPWLFKS